MSFVLKQKPTFTTSVRVHTPNDGGGFDESVFKCVFKQLTTKQVEGLSEKPAADVLREVLSGWKDLVDESNKPVDFNESNLEALIAIPQALAAVNNAFWKGLAKAPEKN